MLALVPLVALLANVAKVDIRATGTLTSEAILEALLQTTYAGAGLTITGEHMTVHTGTPGATVVEVTSTGYTNEQVDGYWCMNDPMLRNTFKDLAVINTGLSDVTDVITCIGASGEGCASSTPCGGGSGGGDVDDDGTPDPAPEPAPEPAPDQGGGGGDDGGGNKLSTVAIVFIVLGALIALAILVFLLWPWVETCWKPTPDAKQPMVSAAATTGASAGAELPPLYPTL